jgi:hypothetical protein
MPSPTPNSPFRSRHRKLGPTELRGRRDRLHLACHVLASLATLPPTPDAGTLAGATGWTVDELMPVLANMEQAELVELWGDPTQPGVVRVMLSAAALANLGLQLSPRGDRWECQRRWNPDRPPLGATAVSTGLSNRGSDLSDSSALADGASLRSE